MENLGTIGNCYVCSENGTPCLIEGRPEFLCLNCARKIIFDELSLIRVKKVELEVIAESKQIGFVIEEKLTEETQKSD